MKKNLRCPVCGKGLSESEYDKALGLWKEKQEHIQHLQTEQKKLKEQERLSKKHFDEKLKSLKQKELFYKNQSKKQEINFKKQLADAAKNSLLKLREERRKIERSASEKLKKGIETGVLEQKKQLAKEQSKLKKTQNKMAQLENSLKVSARKYEQSLDEIKKLKEQIEKGITPQIEGLLEESKLLAKLKELFTKDKFDHPGKGGDIVQTVVEQGKEIGKIVYECKKVKHFDKKHVEQARIAREYRQADFAILVTNAFPSKKQFYFVAKSVFVISPVSVEPITYTLRESLVKIALLKMSNEAKEKAVQKVYDYLSSNDYNNKMNGVAEQLMELGKDLKSEMTSHKRIWAKRYQIYGRLFNDIGIIDNKLKDLVHRRLDRDQKMLTHVKSNFIVIKELE